MDFTALAISSAYASKYEAALPYGPSGNLTALLPADS
jgi:hypothetical protein